MTNATGTNENPYHPPAEVLDEPAFAEPAKYLTGKALAAAFCRWLGICSVAAIPSFLLGYSLSQAPYRVAAMLSGILLFAILYAFVERLVFAPRAARDRRFYRSLWIAYGCRVVASVIFPVGMWCDVFLGLASVGFSQWLFADGDRLSRTISVFSTTVVQGLLMNFVVLGFFGFVYAVQCAWGRGMNRQPAA